MTAGDGNHFLRAAMAAVRDCAETMETQAASLRQSLTAVPIDERLRTAVIELCGASPSASKSG